MAGTSKGSKGKFFCTYGRFPSIPQRYFGKRMKRYLLTHIIKGTNVKKDRIKQKSFCTSIRFNFEYFQAKTSFHHRYSIRFLQSKAKYAKGGILDTCWLVELNKTTSLFPIKGSDGGDIPQSSVTWKFVQMRKHLIRELLLQTMQIDAGYIIHLSSKFNK